MDFQHHVINQRRYVGGAYGHFILCMHNIYVNRFGATATTTMLLLEPYPLPGLCRFYADISYVLKIASADCLEYEASASIELAWSSNHFFIDFKRSSRKNLHFVYKVTDNLDKICTKRKGVEKDLGGKHNLPPYDAEKLHSTEKKKIPRQLSNLPLNDIKPNSKCALTNATTDATKSSSNLH
uniref:Uncharacterized protein n=1 Tax=Glossina pallidipes TaxID=7398 RepID=A0A1B0A8I2_GLOPL